MNMYCREIARKVDT